MYAKILVPLDGSHNSDQALKEAIRLAKSFGSQVEVIHVVNYNPVEGATADLPEALVDAGNKLLADARQRIEATGLSCVIRLIDNPAAAVDVSATIIEIAHECHAELVAIGADSKLGSVAEKVMNQCPLPVWIIRGSKSDAQKT
jgi:nucleotide-binding universal stress UspA family protein